MPQHGRFVVTQVVLVLLVTLLSPSTGRSTGAEPLPPTLLPPVSAQAGIDDVTYTGCGGQTAPVVDAAYEQELVERVNSVRASYSLPPLKRADPLDDAARYHATDLGQDNYFDHDSYDRSGGALVLACGWSARITTYYPGWGSLAENIAAGYGTPASVMDGWMGSPGHRANILSTSNWEIGVGYYTGSGGYASYWVQDFGRRQDIYPLIINGDAASTDSRDVSLYLYGDWQEMRLRNDDGTWTAWQPFQSALGWTLAAGRGDHTVSAELRDGARTATSSDRIFLDAASPALGDLPDSLAFSYNLWNGRLAPSAYVLVPENVASEDPLTWTLTQEGDWFLASPTSGTSPASFRIEPTGVEALGTGSYPGAVTVTVVAPPDTAGSPQVIDLVLVVVDQPVVYCFLPIVRR